MELLSLQNAQILHPPIRMFSADGVFNEAKVGLSGFTDYEVFFESVDNHVELSETQLKGIFHDLDEEAHNLDRSSTFDLYPGLKTVLESLASFGWIYGILAGNTSTRMAVKSQLPGIADYFLEDFLLSCNFGDFRDDFTKKTRDILNSKKYLKVLILGIARKIFQLRRYLIFL